MLKKTVTYTDFDDNQQTETLYFNLSKAELIEMEATHGGDGFAAYMQTVVSSGDGAKILMLFKTILGKSYGVKSPDGRRFIKSNEQREEFLSSPAFDELFSELATDPTAAAAFVNGVMPADLMAQVQNQNAAATAAVAAGTTAPTVTTQPLASTITPPTSVPAPVTPTPAPAATVKEVGTVPNAFQNRRRARPTPPYQRPQTPAPVTAVAEDVNLANATPEQLQAALAAATAKAAQPATTPPASS